MTEPELRTLITNLMSQEFDKYTTEGLLPVSVDQKQVQFLFELNVEAIFQMILMNPNLKAKLPSTDGKEVEVFIRRMIEESDRRTREQLNLPYRT